MSLAESAIFLGFHSVRMCFLILRSVVITLLAFCTCQCDLGTHFSTSTRFYTFSSRINLCIKKRPETHLALLLYHTSLPSVNLFLNFFTNHLPFIDKNDKIYAYKCLFHCFALSMLSLLYRKRDLVANGFVMYGS